MPLSYMCAENDERYRIIIFKIQKILNHWKKSRCEKYDNWFENSENEVITT